MKPARACWWCAGDRGAPIVTEHYSDRILDDVTLCATCLPERLEMNEERRIEDARDASASCVS